MNVSIIIINYNTFDLTCQCISSVIEFSRDIKYEIILVDNASTECDPDDFLEKFPWIKLVKSENNLGFAGGNNLGIQQAIGDSILLLNSDTLLIENSIGLSLERMRQYPSIGVISCKLVYPDGNVQHSFARFPSIWRNLFELFRLHKVFKDFGSKYLLSSFYDGSQEMEVDWIWGTFFMMPRSVLEQLPDKQLSAKFFMYAEDMEWCYDIRKLGYKILYFPSTKLIHYMGGSKSPDKIRLIENNIEELIKRWHGNFYLKLYKLSKRLLSLSQRNAI
jgi:GT2 family glycosyltransferase